MYLAKECQSICVFKLLTANSVCFKRNTRVSGMWKGKKVWITGSTEQLTCAHTYSSITPDIMKSLFDWHSPSTTREPSHFLCHATVSMNHQFICVAFVPEMAGWVVLLDLWNHYGTLDISTWSLSQDCKIYTSPAWQLTLHGWVDWGLYEKKKVYCATDLYVWLCACRTSCWKEVVHSGRDTWNTYLSKT